MSWVVKETTIPVSKFSAIFANVATTILPCIGFLWGVYVQIRIMEMRIELLEKFSTTSVADRSQLHEAINTMDKRLEGLSGKADTCKERFEDVKQLLQQHTGKFGQ